MKKISKEALRRSFLAGIITESQLLEKSVIDEPITLSQAAANPELAKNVVYGGEKDGNKTDDAVAGKKTSIPVGALKPAQTEIIKEKAFGMAINFLLKGQWENQDFGNIVSNDNYIMDGHHRWAAVNLIDPRANAVVTQIDLPGINLVSALNLITVGMMGVKKGNVGKGNVAEFTGQNFKDVINNAVINGIGGEYPISAEEVKKGMLIIPGANGNIQAAAKIMMQNADSMPKQVMPGAPARVEMPVIDSSQVDSVKNMMAKGAVDLKEPHSQGVLSNPLNESDVRRIIREEVYGLMQEIGEEPVKLAQDMIKSDEEQIKSLELELKFRMADSRVSSLPDEERKARRAAVEEIKDKLEMAKAGLEMAKQQQINAVMQQQQQASTDAQQGTESQIS